MVVNENVDLDGSRKLTANSVHNLS